jgi:CheY-like chemotaxis protein
MAAPANAPASLNIVLVVDSDVLVRMAICEYLRHCGYRVFEAATAEEAITLLQKTTIPVDVVLTDVDLSGAMNGFGLSQWVRLNRPGTDVAHGRNRRTYRGCCRAALRQRAYAGEAV